MSFPESPASLFDEILGAPDRDGYAGCERVLSFREDDEPEFLADIERHASARVSLTRRGIWHGQWAQVDAAAAAPGPPLDAVFAQRWHTARPILRRAAFDPAEVAAHVTERDALHGELRTSGSLRRFLARREQVLAPHFRVDPRHQRLFDAERDIEQVRLSWIPGSNGSHGARPRPIDDLWVRASRLSIHREDRSLRLRLSFGKDRLDDASRDLARHRRVTELAEILLPESRRLHGDRVLGNLVDELCEGPTFLTQHIAYWNSPDGGALFHHDAFDEAASGGQRGVLFAQFSGATAWLALSIEDLARRVREFTEYLAEGELPWVRKQLFGRGDRFERLQNKCKRFRPLMKELARPGCGFLGPLVNRGPEFTSFLADCGHAYLLYPGDVILLPNHGLEQTAAHSVFCAGDSTGYGLSMAIRDQVPPEHPRA